MRELNWNMLDNFKRQLYLKFELKKILLKSIKKNSSLPHSYKYLSCYKYSKISKWSIIAQQTNRCVFTGRQHAVNKKTQLSRFKFRIESYKGNLPGFSRASW